MGGAQVVPLGLDWFLLCGYGNEREQQTHLGIEGRVHDEGVHKHHELVLDLERLHPRSLVLLGDHLRQLAAHTRNMSSRVPSEIGETKTWAFTHIRAIQYIGVYVLK